MRNEKSTPKYWDERVKNSKGDPMQLVMNSTELFHNSLRMGEKLIKLFVKPEMHILDIGCGYGRFYSAFRDAGAVYTGIDFSEEMVAEAKKKNPDGNFVHASWHDIDKLFRTEMKFDLVFECICLSSFSETTPFYGHGNMDAMTKVMLKAAGPEGMALMIEPDEIRIATNHNLLVDINRLHIVK